MADEIYNDASIPHGSAVLTCNGVTYDCDDFEEPLDNTKTVKRNKANGAFGGSFGIRDALESSCTVQLATSSTVLLRGGATFTTDVTGAKVWYIVNAGRSHPKENYKVQKITFIEKLN